MAFVLVQHLDPQHESQLTELLQGHVACRSARRRTGMTGGAGPRLRHPAQRQPGSIDRRPPATLTPRGEARGPHLPIDFLLGRWRRIRAAAGDRRGPLGHRLGRHARALRRSRRSGGITFAQDEHSARHAGMPRARSTAAASTSSCRRRRSPASWREIGAHPYLAPDTAETRTADAAEDSFQRDPRPACGPRPASISASIATRRSSGGSCAAWRCTPARRWRSTSQRLEGDRRRGRGALPRPPDQRHQLLPRPGDVRGPEGARLPRDRRRASRRATPIRVWVPGCSTGQEAYSLAMALLEFLDDAAGPAADPDLRHRPERPACAGQGAGRRLSRRASRRRSRRSGCGASSRRRTTATGSTSRSATCASSPGRTWRPIRRSRTSI